MELAGKVEGPVFGRGRHRRASPLAEVEELCAGAGPEGPLLVICGGQLGSWERAMLASRLASAVPGVGALVVEDLCHRGHGLPAVLGARRTSGLVLAACDQAGAAAAVGEAVSLGIDSARAASVLLPPALFERERLLEAVCLAGAKKAEMLADEPLAGRARLQLQGAIDRRTLLSAWREVARHTALLDSTKCLGASRCGVCIDGCPVSALRTSAGVFRVDTLRCTSCGRCTTLCPSGALSLPGASLAGLAAELETLLGEGVDSYTIACAKATAEPAAGRADPGSQAAIVALPCVAMASPGLLLGLLARGASVDLAGCPGCPSDQALIRSAGFVERILGALDRADLSERLLSPGRIRTGYKPRAASGDPVAPPAGALHPLELREPLATSSAIALLLSDPGVSRVSEEDIVDDGAPGGIVRIDAEACTLCGACVLGCPAGAIEWEGDPRGLVVDTARCIGCSRCVAGCPEKAVRVVRGINLQGVQRGPVHLVPRRAEVAWSCSRCGMTVEDDPMLAAVTRRLTDYGASATLLASLRRCPGCGSPAPRNPGGATPRGPR